MSTDATKAGNIALITGGAAGIGLSAAHRFAQSGMNIVLVDVRDALFPAAEASLRAAGAADVVTRQVDVSDKAACRTAGMQAIFQIRDVDVKGAEDKDRVEAEAVETATQAA